MIITLCGSMKFEKYFKAWNEALSLAGHTVFTVSAYPSFKKGVKDWYTEDQKIILDLVHLKKIEASDAVLILNVCAYMGESTLKEFQYAKMSDKKIYILEAWGKGKGITTHIHTKKAVKDKIKTKVNVNYVSPIDATEYLYPFRLLDGDSKLTKIVKDVDK